MAAAYVVVPAASKVLYTTATLSNPGISETVRRTRAYLGIVSDQSAAAEDQIGAIGMVVVSDLAIAAGVASLPSPVFDGNDDGWFMWQSFAQEGSSGGGSQSIWYYPIDSKAMRRVEEGFAIAVVVENAHATDGLKVHLGISLLTSLS